MGCFQSKNGGMSSSKAAAAAALAQEAALAREADATAQAAAASAHASAMLEQRNRPQSEVMKRAGAFDKLDADSKAPPQLKEVPANSVSVGERNSKLLLEFERREAEARAAPVLRDVRTTDVRNSKIFGKLQEFEANDARAAAEPKLEKTFSQRQGERAAVAAAA